MRTICRVVTMHSSLAAPGYGPLECFPIRRQSDVSDLTAPAWVDLFAPIVAAAPARSKRTIVAALVIIAEGFASD